MTYRYFHVRITHTGWYDWIERERIMKRLTALLLALTLALALTACGGKTPDPAPAAPPAADPAGTPAAPDAAQELFQTLQDEGIGIVDKRRVETRKIDLGGGLGIVAEPLADYRQRDAFRLCRRCPAVAGHI